MKVYYSWESRIASTASGITSATFSAVVISMILRSREGLSSPYHRIMLFMSVWDFISSACIALTIIPMPADVQETYPFPGRAYGNSTTCQLQGFLIISGQAFGIFSNCVLNIFYVYTIRFGIPEDRINSRMLPKALILASLVTIPSVSIPLHNGLYNPIPYEMYCTIGSYPENCNRRQDVDCIGKYVDPEVENQIILIVFLFIFIGFLSVVVSMILVVMAVIRFDRMSKRLQSEADHEGEEGREAGQNDDHQSNPRSQRGQQDFKATKAAGKVALMYIFAFFLTWIWTFLSILQFKIIAWRFIQYARTIFVPLQGFFNGLIFIYNKIENYRRTSSSEIPFISAFKSVIASPNGINTRERLISCMDLIENHCSQEEIISNSNDADDSKWDEMDTRETPSQNLNEVLSETNMKHADFDEVKDAKFDESSPKRSFYDDVKFKGRAPPSYEDL